MNVFDEIFADDNLLDEAIMEEVVQNCENEMVSKIHYHRH